MLYSDSPVAAAYIQREIQYPHWWIDWQSRTSAAYPRTTHSASNLRQATRIYSSIFLILSFVIDPTVSLTYCYCWYNPVIGGKNSLNKNTRTKKMGSFGAGSRRRCRSNEYGVNREESAQLYEAFYLWSSVYHTWYGCVSDDNKQTSLSVCLLQRSRQKGKKEKSHITSSGHFVYLRQPKMSTFGSWSIVSCWTLMRNARDPFFSIMTV
jgi:hypothetical protein